MTPSAHLLIDSSGVSSESTVNRVSVQRTERRCRGSLLSALCDSSTTLAPAFEGSGNSDRRALLDLRKLRHTSSTVPLEHGQYGSVTWCDGLSDLRS